MITHKIKNLDICDKIYFINNGKLKLVSDKNFYSKVSKLKKKLIIKF